MLGGFMKNKYNDNKLAEELDLIVLLNDAHKQSGLPTGSLGTLTYSYTGRQNPLYAEFAFADGTKKEEPLDLSDFRVLNAKNERDLSVIIEYLKKQKKKERTDVLSEPSFHVCR